MDEEGFMKNCMKYAAPLMMLGFPVLLFAANVLLLNAKDKNKNFTEDLPIASKAGAFCNPDADDALSIGGVFREGNKLYRCVKIFNAKYQPVGAAWVEEVLSREEIRFSSN